MNTPPLLLAWLPDPRDLAETERGILADEDHRQSAARPARQPVAPEEGLARRSDLGTCAGEETGSENVAQNPTPAGFGGAKP